MLHLRRVSHKQGGFHLSADILISAPITALLGPSGAGKSTLLNVIAGFVEVESGAILWKGRDITALHPGKRPVSILFQDNNLFPHLSILDNLALAVTQSKPSEAQRVQIAAALARVDLSGLEGRKPGTLSGGQQARAALARIILQQRPLMLLDEAFASLGPALKRDMLHLVKEVRQVDQMQVIMISHDPSDALEIAQDGIVVADGNVTEPVPIKALLKSPPKALAEYLGI